MAGYYLFYDNIVNFVHISGPMKTTIRTIFISALAVVASFISVVYISCKPDRCANVICANGGTCNAGKCVCMDWYEGSSCQTACRLKFLGSWGVNNNSSVTEPAKFTVSVVEGSTVEKVAITHFHSFFTAPVVALIHGDSIIISRQKLQGKFIEGSGYIYSDGKTGIKSAINLTYAVTDSVTGVAVFESENWGG